MNGQAETRKSLWQYGHYSVGIPLRLKTYYEVISVADNETSPVHPGLHLLYEPFIKHIMKEYIGQQWRYHPTLCKESYYAK